MYKIEFNEDMTLEGILESFDNLKAAEIDAYIEINGIKIYSTDTNFKICISEEYKKYHDNHKKNINKKPVTQEVNEKISMDEQVAKEEYTDFSYLNQNKRFLFELGIVLEYTREEYKNMILLSEVYYYGPTKQKKVDETDKYLNYTANILLILDTYNNDNQKRFEIMKIFNTIGDNMVEYAKFKNALDAVMMYTTKAEELKKLLYSDILDEPTKIKRQIYENIKKHE